MVTIVKDLLVQLLELNDVRKNIFEDMLRVLGVVRQLAGHAQDVSALPDEVLEVLLPALVGDLREPGLLAGESLVEVKELQLG